MTGKEKIDFCCSFTLFSTQSSIYIIVAPVIPNPSFTLFYYKLQSWTKVLTHLSKANAFYRRPSVTSKSIFFVDSQPPISMLQYALWTLSPGYNIEKGRGGRNVKIRHCKLTRWTKWVFFGECLNYFCLWLSELYFTHSEAFPVSSLFVYSEIFSIIV